MAGRLLWTSTVRPSARLNVGGPLGIWRDWANDVTGHPIEGGHFFPEHNPRETAVKLPAFFAA
jgi:surfactin synthase thioesterase subunit